jgi:hypothetical protein
MLFALRLLVGFAPFQKQSPLFTLEHAWQICDGKHCRMRDRCVIYCDRNRRNDKQGRQYTYNVTIRHALAIIIGVEKIQLLHILRVCL